MNNKLNIRKLKYEILKVHKKAINLNVWCFRTKNGSWGKRQKCPRIHLAVPAKNKFYSWTNNILQESGTKLLDSWGKFNTEDNLIFYLILLFIRRTPLSTWCDTTSPSQHLTESHLPSNFHLATNKFRSLYACLCSLLLSNVSISWAEESPSQSHLNSNSCWALQIYNELQTSPVLFTPNNHRK